MLAGARLFATIFAKADCAGSADVLAALVVMFAPQVWLYGLAVVSAVLQAHHRFLAAAAPLVSSVVVIIAYLGYAALAAQPTTTRLELTDQALAALAGARHWVSCPGRVHAGASGRIGLRLRPRLRFAEVIDR